MLPVNVYYDDLLQLLIATGTYWTPTLAVVFGLIPEGSPLRRAMLAEVNVLIKRAYLCLRAPIHSIPETTTAKV